MFLKYIFNNKHTVISTMTFSQIISLPREDTSSLFSTWSFLLIALCVLSPKELEIPPRADNFGTIPGQGWHGDDSAHPGERGLCHSGSLPPLLPCESRAVDASLLEYWAFGTRQPRDRPLLELSSAQWTQIPEPSWSWFSSVRNSSPVFLLLFWTMEICILVWRVNTGMAVALTHTPNLKSSIWTPRLADMENQTRLLVLRATINGHLHFYFIYFWINNTLIWF